MGWYDTVSSEVRHEGITARVRVDELRMPDGSTAAREVVERVDAVAVVPLRPDRTVVLLKQYRHPVGGYVLEIPAGKLDVDGEAVEAAGRRELAEEAHLDAGSMHHLTTFLNSAGWSTERTHVYLGTELSERRPPDDFEADAEEAEMEIVVLRLDEALAAVRDGTIRDAKTVIGLLLTADHLGGPGSSHP